MSAFEISEDDIIAVAARRGVEMDDAQASRWFDELDHGLIEVAALRADDMDEQTELAFDAIDSQLDELGCWDPRKAQLAAEELDEGTPRSNSTRPTRI